MPHMVALGFQGYLRVAGAEWTGLVQAAGLQDKVGWGQAEESGSVTQRVTLSQPHLLDP